MNLIINDTDHSLIIKVASIQAARMQVYFIENEDFFQNREVLFDEKGVEYEDNDERSIFFIRGVMETIKKLRWIPDIIHCHGWMTALTPFYIKEGYKDDPCFKDTKVVYSIYDDAFTKSFEENFPEKLRFDTISDKEIKEVATRGIFDFNTLTKFAIDYSDGVVQQSENISAEVTEYIKDKKPNFLAYDEDFEKTVDSIEKFYENIDH